MARTAEGLIRSTEMAGQRKLPKKILDHIRVMPSLGGGVRVEHHHTSFDHPPEHHEFKPQDAEKFYTHMEKHTGLSWDDGAQNENQVEKAGT